MTLIRPMVGADVAAVADLTSELGYPVDADELGRRLSALESAGAGEVLVAVDRSDRPVGWIHVARMPSLEASGRALIGGLVVGEAHRSAGIGAELVAAAEAWAAARGCVAIVARSRTTRERAHRFYERLGYREQKRSVVFEKPLR
jgi:GNAT superfamily N-acetyltransferase